MTKILLNKIETTNKQNNTFITICRKTALKEAKLSEKELMRGNYLGPLHGIPISVKDNICVKDVYYTNGSKMFNNRIGMLDAEIIKRIRKRGVILLGKTNMDEFANNVVGINEFYGTIRNPYDDTRSAGGSSGGSAASVAFNSSFASIGTDTSGSVRIPAACCGVVGLKPSYDLISTKGIEPLSYSLDHVGVLAKSCTDANLILQSFAPKRRLKEYINLQNDLKVEGLKIGIPNNPIFNLLADSIKKKVNEVIEIFKKNGATTKKLNIDNIESASYSREIIIGAEASLHHKEILLENKESYEKENVDFLTTGFSFSKEEYQNSLAVKQKSNFEIGKSLENVDVLLTPTLPIDVPNLNKKTIQWGEGEEESVLNALSRLTGIFNMSGHPALNVPVGFDDKGLPIGIQIVGNIHQEQKILSIGEFIMHVTG